MNLEQNTLMLAIVHQATLAQQASELPRALQMVQEATKQVEQLKAELTKEREERSADNARHIEQITGAMNQIASLTPLDLPEVKG